MIPEPRSGTRQHPSYSETRTRQEIALDEALKATFPASDPLSAEQPTLPAEEPDRAAIETSENRTRQGVTGHNVRYVLAVGLVGAVFAMMLLYLLY